MHNLIERLSVRIRELRKRRGFTQEVLAIKAKISLNYLNDIERGVRNPSTITLNRIAEALKVQLWEIFLGMEKYDARPTVEEIRFKDLCRTDKPRKGKTPAWRRKYPS